MADWAGVRAGISQGYLLGKDSGGKLSGLGMVLNKIANQLTTQRQTSEAMRQKQQLLGMEEASKIRMAQEEGKIKSTLQKEEYALKPTTQFIVDRTGKKVGQRPVGAVFQPPSMGFWDEETGAWTPPLTIPTTAPAPTGKFNPLRVLPGYADYGENKKDAYNALRSRGISEKETKKRLGL